MTAIRASNVVSTSTRNFPNRLGYGASVYPASRAAVASILGKLPGVENYMDYCEVIEKMSADIYKYPSFDQIARFKMAAGKALNCAVSM